MDEPWFRQQGFHSNPFSIKPAAFHDELIGYKLEPIQEKVEQGSVVFVEAPLGTGKTTILKRLFRTFGGKRKLIYYSHTPSEQIQVERLLKGVSVFGKLFGNLPKDIILLIDEASDLAIEDYEDIQQYVKEGNLKSVVFFGTKYRAEKVPEALLKRLDGNVMQLGHLTPEQAVQLIRKRIGKLGLISDEVIQQVFVRADYNPRRLLEVCEDICKEAVASSAQTVKSDHVEKVLGAKQIKKVKKRKKKAPSKQKVVIHEVKIHTSDNFNLENVRTYDEEMSFTKQGKHE